MSNRGIKTLIDKNTPWDQKPIFTKKHLERLKSASSITLAVLAATGTIALSVVAPNLISTIGRLTSKKRLHFKKRHPHAGKQTTEALYYLKRSGMIRLKSNKKDFLISLTNLGKRKIRSLNLEGLYIPSPKTWDGRWWLVAADIPTKDHRQAADQLRRKLIELNFFPLQRTIWIYPFNPSKELDFLLHQFHIQHFVTLMEINRLDKEDHKIVKKHFQSCKIL